MSSLGTVWAELGLRLDKFDQGLKNAQARVRTAAANVESAFQRAERSSLALAAGVGAVAAAAGALGLKGVQLAGQLEQSRIAFTTMLGDAQKADAFLRELWDFAATTPFEFEGLQQSARQLLAFGFEAERIIPMMTSIGDAVSALGGGSVEIDRVTRALGQMQAKGKVSAEEMMQLAELGIPAWELLANKIGVSIPEAMKLAEQGGINAATGINAILTGLNDRFVGAMEQQSRTLLGLWSTAKDNITGILRTIGEEIVSTFDLKDKLAGAIEALQYLNNLLREKGLRGALAELFPPERAQAVAMLAGAIAGPLVVALGHMALAAWAAVAPLLPFAAIGAVVAGVAYLIYKNWRPLKEFFGDLWGFVLAKVNQAKETIIAGMERMAVKVGEAWNNIKRSIYEAILRIMEIVEPVVKLLPESWQNAFENMRRTVQGKTNDIQRNLDSLAATQERASERIQLANRRVENAWYRLTTTTSNQVSLQEEKLARRALAEEEAAKKAEAAHNRVATSAQKAADTTATAFAGAVETTGKVIDLHTYQLDRVNAALQLLDAREQRVGETAQMVQERIDLLAEKKRLLSLQVENLSAKYQAAVSEHGLLSEAAVQLKEKIEQVRLEQERLAGQMDATNKKLQEQREAAKQAFLGLAERAAARGRDVRQEYVDIVQRFIERGVSPTEAARRAAASFGLTPEQILGRVAPFASGGIVTSPTLALLGETSRARPEIVSPQRLMAETFRGVLREEMRQGPSLVGALREALQGLDTGTGSITIPIYLDGREIARHVIDPRKLRQAKRALGTA